MRIEYKEEPKSLRFMDSIPGDTFGIEGSREIYLVVRRINPQHNAVNLTTSEIVFIDPSTRVKNLNILLTILQ